MSKYLIAVLIVTLLLGGCSNQNGMENTKGPSIMEARKDSGRLSSDELIRDARNDAMINVEETPARKIASKEEAKSRVMDYLDLKEHDSTSVSFEGMEGNFYVFHATDLVHFNNHPENLSRGWYKVNRNTGKVSSWEH